MAAQTCWSDDILIDPFVEGRPRLSDEPVILDRRSADALAHAACALAMMLDEVVPVAAADPVLAAQLGISGALYDIARLDAPAWLGLSRADVFLTTEGVRVCELNCDTPTGLAECVVLGAHAVAAHATARDPSAQLRARWLAMVASALPAGCERSVALIEPTEFSEDVVHARLLRRWLSEDGWRVEHGSPFNLHALEDDRIGVFGQPCSVMVRHYKTDWWAERRSPWRDEPPPPAFAPLHRELALVARSMRAGRLGVVNPWGSAIGQSKRALAIPWQRPELLRRETLRAVRRVLPETRWLDQVELARIEAERCDWVLKSAFGCEGEEVILGREVTAELWRELLHRADPAQWVVQRAFTVRNDGQAGQRNHGIFLIGGAPSGIYTRTSAGATTALALSQPTLVLP